MSALKIKNKLRNLDKIRLDHHSEIDQLKKI